MTKLSVNLNKVALLRNSREGSRPSVADAAEVALDSGADGITLHWRADNRHTRRHDVCNAAQMCRQRGVEFNLEGDLREELIDLACQLQPAQTTLVPVSPGEVTSDHGWQFPKDLDLLTEPVARLKQRDIRVSLFVDPDPAELTGIDKSGADRIEIYTGPYAHAVKKKRAAPALHALAETFHRAELLGFAVNAGHDLDLDNLDLLLATLPGIAEVSIGHALICDALNLGLSATVAKYAAHAHRAR